MFFGKKLKEFRLNLVNMGLHNFAKKIGMCPLELSNIERGICSPPTCKMWIYNISIELGLEHNSLEDLELYNSWSQPFVMQKMSENVIVSPLSHKSDGTILTTEEYIDLNEHINSIAREHNKRAEEYNKEHNGL